MHDESAIGLVETKQTQKISPNLTLTREGRAVTN